MRTLSEISVEIQSSWKVILNSAAIEALKHMAEIGSITENAPYGYEVVGSFLGNSMGWRGDVARRVKKELREMCDHPNP